MGRTREPAGGPASTLRGDADASDHGDTGHGTHVAGIAAAPANGVGIVGVAPASATDGQVIPVQIADTEGASTDETMIRGIRWAVSNGAKVINISAGGPGYSRAFHDTVRWASRKGALIVASVGNEGQDVNALNYPAGYSRVLGVGAQCDGDGHLRLPEPVRGRDLHEPQPHGRRDRPGRRRALVGAAPGHRARRARPATPSRTAPRWPRRTSPASPRS